KARAAAIAGIPSELTRKKSFVDTRRTLMDFAIRQYLLGLEEQHCQRYAELKHYLLRKDGNVIPWFQGLGPRYQDSWKAAEPIMAKRAFALGLIRELRGHSARTFFHEASRNLSSGVSLLVWASISAQHSVLLTELAYCHPKNVEIAEFTRLQKIASRWPWYKKSVSTTLGEGPSTITAQDSMDLYWAYLRSKSRGVGRKVRMRTDAVLARHPPSDPKHGMVISRIQKIVATGQGYERSQAARMGLRETELAGRVRAALDGDKARLWMSSPMCTEFLKAQTYVLKSAWKSYKGLNPRGRTGLTRKESAIDRLGSSIGPLVYAECYRTKKSRRPLSATKVLAQIRRGVKRLHPHPRKSSKCGAAVQRLTADSGSYSLATGRIDKLGRLLGRLHTLQTRRCLVP
ncbi:MAG: hypothetical protein JKY56_08815, partial [Kofleriaceae bacterium]|nr:hypothetical protein [Kofleriaceae bacterium]